MCLFITAVVPRSALCSGFDAVVARHRLAFRPCRNPHVIAQLKAGEHYTLTSAGGCDCGSPLFFAARDRIGKQIGKLRAKGWSNAKISRWVEDSRPRTHQQKGAQDRCWSISDWAAFLEEALAQPKVSVVGLIGHWYQGDVDSEPFVINGRVTHRVAELRAGSLGVLDQDTIHAFRASAPGDDAAAGIAADL